MLDDLREDGGELDFFDDEVAEEESQEEYGYEYKKKAAPAPREALFMGMTATQRFVIAVMMLMMVCILGTFALLITEKIYLPFL